MDYKCPDQVCRICLQDDNLSSLFTDDTISPSFMIMYCTAMKISQNDGMPSKICKKCKSHLHITYNFKNQCENVDLQLRKNLKLKILTFPLKTSSFPPEITKEIKTDDYDTNCSAINMVHEMLIGHAEKIECKRKENSLLIAKTEDTAKNRTRKYISKAETHKSRRRIITNKMKKLKKPVECFDCGKIFNYSGHLRNHIRLHTGEKPFECNVCNKKFTQRGNLVLHQRTHSGEKPYQCEVCSKQFSTSSNLQAHSKTHIQVRNYQCTECPRAFKNERTLINHAGTHTGIKNKICKVCGKAFYKTNYLNVHLRTVHVGEKKYKCSDCEKEFSCLSNLTCHYRIHTGEKPYSCCICGADFNQSSSLRRHEKQHQTQNVISNDNSELVFLDNSIISDTKFSEVNTDFPIMFGKSKDLIEVTEYTTVHNITLETNI